MSVTRRVESEELKTRFSTFETAFYQIPPQNVTNKQTDYTAATHA